jgi:hypothetical protein
MAESIDVLINKLEGLPDFIQEVLDNFMKDDAEDVLDLNRDQMLLGIDADGVPLGLYSPLSQELRSKKGLQIDHIDLRDTGEFQDSMFLEKAGDNTYFIDAADPKWEQKIAPRFPDALGLTEISQELLAGQIEKEVVRQVDNYL